MIAQEHRDLKLSDFYYSANYKLGRYDYISIDKEIGTLTLTDLSWCLRRRQFLEPVIEIILDKIEENQVEIDQYSTEIYEWYYEVIKEVITIPFAFWDNKHVLFSKYRTFIIKLFKRKLFVESTLLQLFLAYKPKPINWTKEDSQKYKEYFVHELLGNYLGALQMIIELKYTLLNGQGIFIESEFKQITTVQQLQDFLLEEYGSSDDEYYITVILEHLESVRKIKFIQKD